MADAAFHGKSGKAVFDGVTILNLTGWTVNITSELADATIMTAGVAANEWEQSLPGFLDWTATVECNTDDTGAQIPFEKPGTPEAVGERITATPVALTLSLDATVGETKVLSGNAFCTGLASTLDKDDVAKITYSFQGTGALTYT